MSTEPMNTCEMSPYAKATEEFACDHSTATRLTVFTSSNGAKHYRRQCFDCGESVGVFVKRADIPAETVLDALPTFDETIRKTRSERIRSRAAEIGEQERASREAEFEASKPERRRWYREDYLQSPHWRAIRKKVLARAKGQCEGCGEAPATDAHHLTYSHVGREFLFQLVALCRPCHDRYHDVQEQSE